MKVYIVQPIIVRSDRSPDHIVYEDFNTQRLGLMDWWHWYTARLDEPFDVLIRDPLRRQLAVTPSASSAATYFWNYLRPAFSIQEWATCDVVLVLTENYYYPDSVYGYGGRIDGKYGFAWADGRICRALSGFSGAVPDIGDPVKIACGLIQHELGHTFGFDHTDTPEDDLMGEFVQYPNVTLQ